MRAVYGVMKKRMGNKIPQTLKQNRTPSLRATGGNIRNWMKQPMIPYIVNKVPMRDEEREKPPENLKGR